MSFSSGSMTVQAAPTASAKVDKLIGTPSRRFRQGWRQAALLESARVRNGIFHAVCMMESAICAALAKRERRREAGTIWL
jgi:hypothetical protein